MSEAPATVKYECVVHKANVPLASNESLRTYTERLNKGARDYVTKQLNLGTGKCSGYMLEVYADKAVFDVYKYAAMGSSEPGEYKYYGVQYARKANGDFEFKNLTEVERVTSYQAKPSLAITKAKKKAEDDDEEDEEEAELSAKPKSTKKAYSEHWTVKNESLWSGLV